MQLFSNMYIKELEVKKISCSLLIKVCLLTLNSFENTLSGEDSGKFRTQWTHECKQIDNMDMQRTRQLQFANLPGSGIGMPGRGTRNGGTITGGKAGIAAVG